MFHITWNGTHVEFSAESPVSNPKKKLNGCRTRIYNQTAAGVKVWSTCNSPAWFHNPNQKKRWRRWQSLKRKTCGHPQQQSVKKPERCWSTTLLLDSGLGFEALAIHLPRFRIQPRRNGDDDDILSKWETCEEPRQQPSATIFCKQSQEGTNGCWKSLYKWMLEMLDSELEQLEFVPRPKQWRRRCL